MSSSGMRDKDQAVTAALALVANVGGRTGSGEYFAIFATCLTMGFSQSTEEVSMTEERTTPLCEQMIEDMRIQGMGEKA